MSKQWCIGCELTASWCLQSLLSDPNPSSPANADAARLYSEDRSAYKLTLHCSIAELHVDPKVDTLRKELLCMQRQSKGLVQCGSDMVIAVTSDVILVQARVQ